MSSVQPKRKRNVNVVESPPGSGDDRETVTTSKRRKAAPAIQDDEEPATTPTAVNTVKRISKKMNDNNDHEDHASQHEDDESPQEADRTLVEDAHGEMLVDEGGKGKGKKKRTARKTAAKEPVPASVDLDDDQQYQDRTLVEGEDGEAHAEEGEVGPSKAKGKKKPAPRKTADKAVPLAPIAPMSGEEAARVVEHLERLEKVQYLNKRAELELVRARTKEKELDAKIAAARAVSDNIRSDLMTTYLSAAQADEDVGMKVRRAIEDYTPRMESAIERMADMFAQLAPFAETAMLREKKEVLREQTTLLDKYSSLITRPDQRAAVDTRLATDAAHILRREETRRIEAETSLFRAKERHAETVGNIVSKKGVPAALLYYGNLESQVTSAILDALKATAPEVTRNALDV